MKLETISYISDIHIDNWIESKYCGINLEKRMKIFIEKQLQPSKSDILIIPGDISDYNHFIKLFLETIISLNLYKKIFIINGNHEMYLTTNSLKHKYKNYIEKIDELKEICKSLNVEFLDGNIVEYCGLKIGGNSMWFDGSYAINKFNYTETSLIDLWKQVMNDSKFIIGKDKSYELNQDFSMYNNFSKKKHLVSFHPLKFFTKEKEKFNNIFKECDIYISHFPPFISEEFLDKCFYAKNKELAFYLFDCSNNIDDKKRLWFFGHIHNEFNFNFKNTKFVSNPLGYKEKNKKSNISIKTLNIKDFF